jgi:hypothetical protein
MAPIAVFRRKAWGRRFEFRPITSQKSLGLTIERFFASLRFEQRGMLDQLGEKRNPLCYNRSNPLSITSLCPTPSSQPLARRNSYPERRSNHEPALSWFFLFDIHKTPANLEGGANACPVQSG